ncbi:MAG: hypothetical protein AAF384_07880 [Pseudomonadota bacterium]
MSQFEFLMIIASIFVAIAITEIISWWGQLLRSDPYPPVSRIHLAWTILFVCNAVLYWSGFWPYRDIAIESYGQIWMLLLPTLFMILVGYALTPSPTALAEHNGKYFDEKRKTIFIPWSVFILLAVLADAAIVESPTLEGAVPGLVSMAVFVSLIFLSNPIINYVGLAFLFLLLFLVPILLGFEGGMEFFAN